ncbi:sulfite exporter TauE/SafE family protein [Porphyrobacter sp. AAP60]|uniref:sulfite exporter TauE/SafE family protein n=1 Tax=Porphyrobacter sp. AAP60 TaxID=1523423 RepID=UPI0006B8CF70|nr:sulfite exporter TauE/SafE family protein [Porphyrobacter sp. AAP60]KPF65036.1 sulfoacetate transporter [Porphyrobacter sp. AAP60]
MIGAVPALLALAFFVTALLYASVGFGGGSTYSALLALSGLDYRLLPLISLACNIVVVTGGSIRFARAGLTPWRKALVIVALGAPASFLGGMTPIREATFLALLGGSLVLTSLTMLIPVRERANGAPLGLARWMPIAAAPLGYFAGLVGIGGGIFLAPLLHLARWHEPRGIAATASLFILVNSLFGLAGQLLKNGPWLFGTALGAALPLLIAVVIGGQIGGLLAARLLPPQWIRWITAALVLVVGVRLLAGV